MNQQVDEIVQQIERLDEADRLLLERKLQQLADAKWQAEATAAREVAAQRGIDQRAIDQAIEDLRYGT